jgi:predicted Zn finger-like uncharacterized protein
MPNVVCPTCGTTLAVTDAMLGGEVQCGQCQQVFRTTHAPPPAPRRATARREDEDDDRREAPRRRDRRDEDEEEDRPSRRRSRRDDDDGDEYADRRRRRRSHSRRDDDDEDDYPVRRTGGGTGMAVTSMILGICAITVELPATMFTAFGTVFCCGLGGFFTWPAHVVGVGLGITGLILGALGMKKKDGKGMAVAGLATSVAALVLGLISIFMIAAGYATWNRAVNNMPVFPPPNNPPPMRGW